MNLEALYDWYRREQRALPFRGSRDPYAIWVSEIMLQQTRVEAMLPLYERFLARFPNVQTLARAPLDEVLSFWHGLGYYNRARNLHRAAGIVVREYGGQFPLEPNTARSLPGIGPYTVAAILSIAADVPLATLDGNVRRVLARLNDSEAAPGDRVFSDWADDLLGARGDVSPGLHNQAMMELGARICKPGRPDCDACPLAPGCLARLRGGAERVAQLPRRSPRVAPIALDMELYLILDASETRVLILNDRESHFLKETWFFPHRLSGLPDGVRATAGLEQLCALGPCRLATGRFRHSITKHRIQGRVALVRSNLEADRLVDGARKNGASHHVWKTVSGSNLPGQVASSMARKALRLVNTNVLAGFAPD